MLCLHFFLTLIKALYCLCAVPPRCGRPRNAERCRTFAAGTAVCVCLQPRCRSLALITCACHCKNILNGWGWGFGQEDGPGTARAQTRRALVHRTWSAANPDSSPFRYADTLTHRLALLSRLVMPALRLRVRGGSCGMRLGCTYCDACTCAARTQIRVQERAHTCTRIWAVSTVTEGYGDVWSASLRAVILRPIECDSRPQTWNI